ncbi:HPr(Ser) kinase/phosphatase [Paenibacillus algorifonticola]|uniref:HPr kinase/phosphorylase n=1 Tax=Paenibacillus sp. BIHB 4019 TaxID=1870819 RepID=A0A1B2DF52_9BACL|nr:MULTISPECIES: HPr(Ser) kinase/phosphatase [unclassified Paenibacillus]ANY66341.1 HPr kinase/phosphorylase [Paenibacillus sp. BIHB 4019]KQO18749.1 serine kinase [Paenibacillus sp. Leaf72]
MPKKVKVSELVQHFSLEIISGEEGLKRAITVDDLYRPGLEMAGYFDYFPSERVQLLGKTEITFLSTLTSEERRLRMERLCHSDTPCIILTRGLEPPDELIAYSNKTNIPVLGSHVATTILTSRITDFLEKKLAPTATIHGVLVDVYGVGMLITGGSGIGKSETALELVKRGHRLVADDAVEIRQTSDSQLHGTAPELIRHLLEIRGLGIINVMTLFGAGAVRTQKRITLVIKLENWQQDKQYDRLGLDEEKTRIIDTDVPLVTVPVRPGRNLAVIIEVAAMNFRLKRMGYNAALQFTNKLTETIAEDADDYD